MTALSEEQVRGGRWYDLRRVNALVDALFGSRCVRFVRKSNVGFDFWGEPVKAVDEPCWKLLSTPTSHWCGTTVVVGTGIRR